MDGWEKEDLSEVSKEISGSLLAGVSVTGYSSGASAPNLFSVGVARIVGAVMVVEGNDNFVPGVVQALAIGSVVRCVDMVVDGSGVIFASRSECKLVAGAFVIRSTIW